MKGLFISIVRTAPCLIALVGLPAEAQAGAAPVPPTAKPAPTATAPATVAAKPAQTSTTVKPAQTSAAIAAAPAKQAPKPVAPAAVASAKPAQAAAAPAPAPKAAALAVTAAPAPATPAVVVSQSLRDGGIDTSAKPHPGTSVQWGRAQVLVAAPSSDVMAVIQNYGEYKSFLPNFEASRVLSQRGTSALVYLQVSILHGAGTIWVEVKLHPRQAPGGTQIVEGKMTKGNVHMFEALWEVTPVDAQHTLVAFQILVDPEMPVPTSLVNGENQKTARKAVRALRDLMVKRKAPATNQPSKA